MRSIGIALATALVGLTAGVASAQQVQTGKMTIQLSGGGFTMGSDNGAAAAVVTPDNGTAALNSSLQGIALTGKQSDSVAKLDAAYAQAVAAADAQHTAAVRVLLTDAQRAKFDENEKTRQYQMTLAHQNSNTTSVAQPANNGTQTIQLQMSGAPGGGMKLMPVTPTPDKK